MSFTDIFIHSAKATRDLIAAPYRINNAMRNWTALEYPDDPAEQEKVDFARNELNGIFRSEAIGIAFITSFFHAGSMAMDSSSPMLTGAFAVLLTYVITAANSLLARNAISIGEDIAEIADIAVESESGKSLDRLSEVKSELSSMRKDLYIFPSLNNA